MDLWSVIAKMLFVLTRAMRLAATMLDVSMGTAARGEYMDIQFVITERKYVLTVVMHYMPVLTTAMVSMHIQAVQQLSVRMGVWMHKVIG